VTLEAIASVKRADTRSHVAHAEIEHTLRLVRELLDRMQRPREVDLDVYDRRRAEDRFREEHHDANAKVISVRRVARAFCTCT